MLNNFLRLLAGRQSPLSSSLFASLALQIVLDWTSAFFENPAGKEARHRSCRGRQSVVVEKGESELFSHRGKVPRWHHHTSSSA